MTTLEDELLALFNLDEIYHGLDLGTSTSLWAYKRKNSAPKTVDYSDRNKSGIPSLFWADQNGKEYIADEVLINDGQLNDPLGVCASVKMRLSEKEIKLHNKSYLPRNIMEKIIRRVIEISKNDLQRECVDIKYDGLVVGVPATFSAAEKGTILASLESVTGCQTIRLVPEPILAAISSSYYSQHKERPTLVYDLGAGTFDACILIPNRNRSVIHPYPYIVANADGLRIAGDRFDEILTELIISELEKNPYTLNINHLKNKNHADRRLLKITAREIKESLSSQETVSKPIIDSEAGIGKVKIDRHSFEKAIEVEIQKTVDVAYKVLLDANLGTSPDIDIVLVGGSSNIPLIRKLIQRKFSWVNVDNIFQRFPEKAVALGAAIFAEMPDVVDNTPVPFAYAVKTHHPETSCEVLRTIVPLNAKLPSVETAFYSPLYDNQINMCFEIFEIHSTEKKEYYELYEGTQTKYIYEHKFGKMVPKDTTIKLTTTLSADGILEIRSDDKGVSVNSMQMKRIELNN